MTYAGGKAILDADSHVMELGDFLDGHIEPGHRDRLRRKGMEALTAVLDNARDKADRRSTDEAAAAEAEERLMQDKGWMAMGGFDPVERSRVMDLLGFEGQLVFATFATSMFSLPRSLHRYHDGGELAADLDLLYAGCRAQNKAMASFCADDERLLPVAYVSLIDAPRAVDVAEEAIAEGCSAIMVPSTAAGDLAPSHPDLDGFWGLLERRNVPFVLHVGGGGKLLDRAFHNNAMPVTDHLGGGENIRSKDYLAIYHSPATFLGALILDGVFDRFPGLRGGCIEQGAGWVVSWMHHLDYAQRAFRRTEEPLRRLEAEPSEYVHRHLKFTPFPGEPVGWMIEQAGEDLFMFSTDYPHPEGGKDPLAKFEAEMDGVGPGAQARFYRDNMAELLAVGSPQLTAVSSDRVNRDKRRELLIEVAANLAAEGVDEVTMDSVAASAGVSRPLVYKHFANRHELLAAVYRREAKLLHKVISVAVSEAATLEDKFRALIRGSLQAQAERGATLLALRAAGGRDVAGRMEQKGRDVGTYRYFTGLAVESLGSDPKETGPVISLLLRAVEGVLAEWRTNPTPRHGARLEEAYVTICRGALAGLSVAAQKA